MWGYHLKQRGRWWHYFRAVPVRYRDVEPRREICFSLRTQDFAVAKMQAARISLDLDAEWQRAVELGTSLKNQSAAVRYAAAAQAQVHHGFKPAVAPDLSDDDLLERLRYLLANASPTSEQKSVLGLFEQPDLSMMGAFERFWDHIEDEWSALSHDQRRVKRNGYLKALSNFREAVGDLAMYEVERRHAMAFRSWWLKRIKAKGLKPHTGNKDINALRRMITTNFDIDAVQKPNPLARVRLKDEAQVPRMPMTAEQIKAMVVPGALGNLAPEFALLLRLLVNTGMRPVEAIGLEMADVILDHAIPHVHIRKNAVRGLKTNHSERLLPLLGVSLNAARELIDVGGWGKRLGKNMYATSILNRHLRERGLVTNKRQSE